MKFHYYRETDSLYIDLSEKTSVDSQEITPGIVLDFDDSGKLVGIDIQNASENVAPFVAQCRFPHGFQEQSFGTYLNPNGFPIDSRPKEDYNWKYDNKNNEKQELKDRRSLHRNR